MAAGLQFVVILLCLPFLTPVTLPGISMPFGLAIALCGLRIAFGHKPWLPAFILEQTHFVFCAGTDGAFRLQDLRESGKGGPSPARILSRGPGDGNGHLAWPSPFPGIFLSLPIPPPFPLTNTIPGFAIIFLSLGLMEKDGGLILCGYVLTLISAIYVTLIGLLGKAGVDQLWRMLEDG